MFKEKYFNVDDHIIYKVDKDAGVVIAYVLVDLAAKLTSELVANANYYDLQDANNLIKVMGIARLKDGDTFNEEAGRRIARLKLIRRLNKEQKQMYIALRIDMEQRIQALDKAIQRKDMVIDNLNTYIKKECDAPYGEVGTTK